LPLDGTLQQYIATTMIFLQSIDQLDDSIRLFCAGAAREVD